MKDKDMTALWKVALEEFKTKSDFEKGMIIGMMLTPANWSKDKQSS